MQRELIRSFHHPNEGQDHNIQIANKAFETAGKFKYLGTTVTK
jgi:hypothetical protein